MDSVTKLAINGHFSNEEVADKLSYKSYSDRTRDKNTAPKHMLMPHPGFETVQLPNGTLAKDAYKKLYSVHSSDLDIELMNIARYENDLTIPHKRKQAKQHLKFHYKKAVSLISPKFGAGWNRWSENILELFINEKLHKVIWGSGNCGKSAIMAILLYIKWRVNPSERMVVIATKVVKDASARVFGYIKEIHAKSPKSGLHKFQLVDSKQDKGIYCLMYDEEADRYIRDDRACIISLPVKVSAKHAEVGSNLLGKHPDDRLVLAFDECQELPATMLSDKIFLNWYTNKRLDVYAWGNPTPIDYHSKEEYDMLFKMGADKLSLRSLREKEKAATKTSTWSWSDTMVLHLAMTDSPKDDHDERYYLQDRGDGIKEQRLHFLAGQENVDLIVQKTTPNSPAWYSQVLGFPFLNIDHSKTLGVLTGFIVKESRRYPLHWKTPLHELQYFMGVDPAASGRNDGASIVVGRMGLMMDGRQGIDLLNGEGCREVKMVEGEDFVDTIVETMYALSRYYKIPLRNISIETHGVGDVLRYALQRHIEDGKWRDEFENGDIYHVVNPTIGPTDRPLFKILGHMRPANELVADITTEYWTAIRCLFLSRQIFNVPDHILQQFYNRQIIPNANSTKYKVESKAQMKKRGINSPNDADALCNMVELVRTKGFRYRFYNKGGYNAFFGPEYDAKKAKETTAQAFDTVSNMLQLGHNLSQYAGAPQKKRKRISPTAIDSV